MARALSILSYVGIALVFGALAVRILRPEWDQYAVYASWTGLVLVLLYTAAQWRDIVAYFQRRNARYGAIASVSVLATLGILIAVNYLSNRENKRWDLTENQQYSLSDQTVQLLRGLEGPVTITVFDQEGNFDGFRATFNEYEYHSDQVNVEYVDPDRRPVQAREFEIQTYGTVIIDYMGRRERLTTSVEQDVTNALIKLIEPQEKRVYFLTGHGEKDPVNTERDGYSAILEALRRDNYEWEKLVLAQTGAVPDNATVVVVAGPQTDLLEQEATLLRDYLSRAGKLLVLLDPPDFTQPAALPNLTALLNEWGIQATNSVVVDVSGLTQVATVPVAAPPYPAHGITERFNLITMFPLARAISAAADAPPERTGQPFVQTTARAWAETNLASLENPDTLAPEPEQGDTAGPVTIAVAVAVPVAAPESGDGGDSGENAGDGDADDADSEAPERQPETRVAAIGDSDFAANAYLGVEGNGDLFMNTVNWLAQQESLIAIRPREASDRRLTMTANHLTGLFWLSIVLVPAAVLGAGVYTWWRRR